MKIEMACQSNFDRKRESFGDIRLLLIIESKDATGIIRF